MQLAIDCASDDVGIALAVDGVIGMSATWSTQQNHSVELLPNIDRLLGEAVRTTADIDAVFVDLGPGGYAALRVGVSVAKALAHGLGAVVVGIGRLELDAYSVVADAGDRRVVAVHRAGRGELAWAAYRVSRAGWREEQPPLLGKREAIASAFERADVVTGDLDDALLELVRDAGAHAASAHEHRVVALASLGNARLAQGRTDDAAALVPLYLRAPAIGPQS